MKNTDLSTIKKQQITQIMRLCKAHYAEQIKEFYMYLDMHEDGEMANREFGLFIKHFIKFDDIHTSTVKKITKILEQS